MVAAIADRLESGRSRIGEAGRDGVLRILAPAGGEPQA
jgi:hypothetical protein